MRWHGYTQHPDAHSVWRWWRLDEDDDWERVDGHHVPGLIGRDPVTTSALLAGYDAENPMPTPPPKCGQVWVWPECGEEAMIVGVRDDLWVFTPAHLHQPEWPPPGAVLVAGPHSPWAPPEAP